MLQQRAAGAVHDRLGHAGGARRVQHVDRMIERQLGERQRLRRVHEVVGIVDRSGQRRRERRRRFREAERSRRGRRRHQHNPLDARKARRDLPHFGGIVEPLAARAVAGRGDQHLGRDLAEAVEHAIDAEIRRAGRPDRADRRGREHRHDGLGRMRHDRGDPVAGPDAVPPERGREARDLPVQLAIAELAPDAVLAQRHDRRTVVAKTQQVLGEVEPRADEPARPRHAVAVDQHLLGRPARHHAGELPERRPKLFRPIDRPGAQRCAARRARHHAGRRPRARSA